MAATNSACGECGAAFKMFGGKREIDGVLYCKNCIPAVTQRIQKRNAILKSGVSHIPAVTVEVPQGLKVQHYSGIVSGRSVVKLDLLQDFFVNLLDDFGGRSSHLQRHFRSAEHAALTELRVEAAMRDANAVVGVRIDYDLVETRKGKMVLVHAIGTAVNASTDSNIPATQAG